MIPKIYGLNCLLEFKKTTCLHRTLILQFLYTHYNPIPCKIKDLKVSHMLCYHQNKGEMHMPYYHCSPMHGLKTLMPQTPLHFDKPARVYMATSLPMALMYGAHHYEYTYGYTKEGQIYYLEHFPGALQQIYGGKSASLYICNPPRTEDTHIPNEKICASPVPVSNEIFIPNVYEALLEEENKGTLIIHRYETLTEKQRNWIIHAEMQEILDHHYLHSDTPIARWIVSQYPASTRLAMEKEQMSI